MDGYCLCFMKCLRQEWCELVSSKCCSMVWNVRQLGILSRVRIIIVVLCYWDFEGRFGYCVDYVYVVFIYCENLI